MAKHLHTPGPWAVEDPMGADIGFWIVQDGLESYEWSCIAIVTGDDEDTRSADARFITEDEQRANALLLAAAPEMRDMLRECRATFAFAADAGDTESNSFIEQIDAVLAKAEGRS